MSIESLAPFLYDNFAEYIECTPPNPDDVETLHSCSDLSESEDSLPVKKGKSIWILGNSFRSWSKEKQALFRRLMKPHTEDPTRLSTEAFEKLCQNTATAMNKTLSSKDQLTRETVEELYIHYLKPNNTFSK
ncbi:MAG: hypothetical protein KBC64_05725 [Simkaniaceae bacterium]|nr:hypothetical protein [Simkaniaceae bacterium]